MPDETVGPEMFIRRRFLPHWQLGRATYFVTSHLRALGTGHGPTAPAPLSRAERQIVKQCLLQHHEQRWLLHVLTVMPTHLHLLATPLLAGKERWYTLPLLVGRAKGRSSRQINLARGERGTMWEPDNHDHIIRDERDYDQKYQYVLMNAVEGGLVTDPWEWDGLWWEGQAEWEGLRRK
jgi:REP element-mobilizing transposase RayT